MATNPALLEAISPSTFSMSQSSAASEIYLRDPSTRKLVEFFERKGSTAIKQEDRTAQWYGDWLEYQARNNLYASVLSPKNFSTRGNVLQPIDFQIEQHRAENSSERLK
jgi:hypothetical protein